MKSNTLKKVLSITIIGIILAVVITTCVLAFVQKSLYNPSVDINDTIGQYDYVTICKDGVAQIYHNNENEDPEKKQVVDDLKEMLADSTKASILSLMFQGTSDFEPTVEPTPSSVGDVMTNVAKAKGKVCLVFDFLDNEQTLMWNGKAYTNDQASDPNAPVTFRKLFIPITNLEEFDVCTAYLADKNNKSNYQIKFLAHQSEIYEYLVSLVWDFYATNE